MYNDGMQKPTWSAVKARFVSGLEAAKKHWIIALFIVLTPVLGFLNQSKTFVATWLPGVFSGLRATDEFGTTVTIRDPGNNVFPVQFFIAPERELSNVRIMCGLDRYVGSSSIGMDNLFVEYKGLIQPTKRPDPTSCMSEPLRRKDDAFPPERVQEFWASIQLDFAADGISGRKYSRWEYRLARDRQGLITWELQRTESGPAGSRPDPPELTSATPQK